jgi:hypothetical protein
VRPTKVPPRADHSSAWMDPPTPTPFGRQRLLSKQFGTQAINNGDNKNGNNGDGSNNSNFTTSWATPTLSGVSRSQIALSGYVHHPFLFPKPSQGQFLLACNNNPITHDDDGDDDDDENV